MSSFEPLFLDVEDVLEIHATQLEMYGGSAGLRDRGLLESAVALSRRGSVMSSIRAYGVCFALGLSAFSCGSDTPSGPGPGGTGASGGSAGSAAVGGTNGSGGGGAGGSGGGGSSGATGIGGTSSGGGGSSGTVGSSGTAGSGGYAGSGGSAGGSTGAHCAPGTTYENFRAYVDGGGPMSNCNGYDPTQVGLSASERISVRNIALQAPLAANQSMAYSIAWIAGNADLEFWGTNEACGAGAERLGTGQSRAPNISCITLRGTSAYSHILMVWRNGGGQHGDVTICPMGSCSP